MSSSRSRRALAALAVLVCLALPAAAHARPVHRPAAVAASHSAGFLSGLWGFLVRLWEGTGMSIDPNGGEHPTTTVDTGIDGRG
ncbi:MAG TPA: hypothetical protein VOA87_01375 [Thermoanaerobaculia bacterium]|nr:hypothetical protein [Thermoanaerobaculia bacterium]